ncbi:MAG: AraC family transcriptional regulator [Pseudomonadota bacterium]
MNIQEFYLVQLGISLFLMLAQLFAPQKRLVNRLFAIFCGAMAIIATQNMSKEMLGPFYHLIGVATGFTCNISWLIARALFRKEKAVLTSHIVIAALITLLVMSNQGFKFFLAVYTDQMAPINAQVAVQEVMGLLSSTLLVLTFWEGARGWSGANPLEKLQRLIFMFAFGLAVFSVLIGAKLLPESLFNGELNRDWLALLASILIMLVMQVLILWRGQNNEFSVRSASRLLEESKQQAELSEEDRLLSERLHQSLVKDKGYLQANLKVADLARDMEVSEYRISRALKAFKVSNFNQFINQLRVNHAKTLLEDAEKSHWPVLVIGLESGFSSVGPFTRAFKTQIGCTPGQYRKSLLMNNSDASRLSI